MNANIVLPLRRISGTVAHTTTAVRVHVTTGHSIAVRLLRLAAMIELGAGSRIIVPSSNIVPLLHGLRHSLRVDAVVH